MGSLYKQPASRIWWVKYYVHGRPVRESTGTADENEAKRILRVREGQTAGGQPILPRADRIRYDEAAEDLRAHYQATGSRDLKEAKCRLAHLERFFGGWRGRRLVQSREATLDFFGGELFGLCGNHPGVAERIGELPGALAIELILHRMKHFSAGGDGPGGDCVHIVHLEMDFHGRTAQGLRADGAVIREFVG